MKKLLFILLILTASCRTPQQQLASLIQKHPELVATTTKVRVDTIIIPEVHHDTTFTNTITKDTIILTKDRLKIQYYNDGKTVYLKGECDSIIKIVRDTISIQTISPIVEKKYIPFIYKFSFWLWIILIVTFFAYLFFKIKKYL